MQTSRPPHEPKEQDFSPEWMRRNPERERTDSERKTDNPERKKRWSIFDIFSRDKESEDDAELKAHDKELRKAAKAHARQVIAPSPEDSNVAENKRKVKKKWRQRLFERSREQVNQLRDLEETTSLSGYQLAQLMVAQRLLQLDHFLQTPSLQKEDKKAIKTHIDFMGLLAEKLATPQFEMPRQIEDIYQNIVQADKMPDQPDYAPSTNASATRQSNAPSTGADRAWYARRPVPETDTPTSHFEQPKSTAATPYGVFVAGVVLAVKKAADKRREEANATVDIGTPDGMTPPAAKDSNGSGTLSQTVDKPTAGPETLPLAAARDLKHDMTPSITNRMETVVDTVDVSQFAVTDLAPAASSTTEINSTAPHLRPNRPEILATVPQVEISPALTTKPVESWPIESLLGYASTVSLGYGQYLHNSYRSGEIDKADLISIIKAHRKGYDYRQVFSERRQRHRDAEQPDPERSLPPHQPKPDFGPAASKPPLASSQTPSAELGQKNAADDVSPHPAEALWRQATLPQLNNRRLLASSLALITLGTVVIIAFLLSR